MSSPRVECCRGLVRGGTLNKDGRRHGDRMGNSISRRERLAEQIRSATGPVGLCNITGNLFRPHAREPAVRLDARDFNHVLELDPASGWVDAEGMTSYENLVLATLACGLMPAVVPPLKTMTIGGAVAGAGIEASAFRQGLVHENILELEVLAGDGNVYLCTPENEHRELFFGFANAYGTLGYALRVRSRTLPVKKFVRLEHLRFHDAEEYFQAIARACLDAGDFLDGVVFAPDEQYLVGGSFVDAAPHTSDYTFEKQYFRSVRERETDFLSTHDFLWRWDTDAYWCSRQFGMQIPALRRFAGKPRLHSRTYGRWARWKERWHLGRQADWLLRRRHETVGQNVAIPIVRAAEFLDFFHREIGILPIWICPFRSTGAQFPLCPIKAAATYVNFGFWDAVRTPRDAPPGQVSRRIGRKVTELGGIQSLYAGSFLARSEFDAAYGGEAYRQLKARYDPQQRFPDLYDKLVVRQ